MTLEEFRATRREVPDLYLALRGIWEDWDEPEAYAGVRGWVYAERGYIAERDGVLTIDGYEMPGQTMEQLEEILFEAWQEWEGGGERHDH